MANYNDITTTGGHSEDKQQSFESRFKEAMEGGVTEVSATRLLEWSRAPGAGGVFFVFFVRSC